MPRPGSPSRGSSTPLTRRTAAEATVVLALLAWRIEALASDPRAPIARGREVELEVRERGGEKGGHAAIQGAKIALASKFVFSIVMIVFLYEFASQILDYQYKTALEGVEGQAATQGFYADIAVIQNTLSVVTQFFLVTFVAAAVIVAWALFAGYAGRRFDEETGGTAGRAGIG